MPDAANAGSRLNEMDAETLFAQAIKQIQTRKSSADDQYIERLCARVGSHIVLGSNGTHLGLILSFIGARMGAIVKFAAVVAV